jgi:hypothetical protein
MPFGDLLVLAIIVLPIILTIALLRAEPLRIDGFAAPAFR